MSLHRTLPEGGGEDARAPPEPVHTATSKPLGAELPCRGVQQAGRTQARLELLRVPSPASPSRGWMERLQLSRPQRRRTAPAGSTAPSSVWRSQDDSLTLAPAWPLTKTLRSMALSHCLSSGHGLSPRCVPQLQGPSFIAPLVDNCCPAENWQSPHRSRPCCGMGCGAARDAGSP